MTWELILVLALGAQPSPLASPVPIYGRFDTKDLCELAERMIIVQAVAYTVLSHQCALVSVQP